jgi:hypothetical protein
MQGTPLVVESRLAVSGFSIDREGGHTHTHTHTQRQEQYQGVSGHDFAFPRRVHRS